LYIKLFVVSIASIGHFDIKPKFIVNKQSIKTYKKTKSEMPLLTLTPLSSKVLKDCSKSTIVYSFVSVAVEMQCRKSRIAWKSKASNSVTLASTEAEYIALSEITKEIMFVKEVLETMGIGMKLPTIVQIDNVGAIYLATIICLDKEQNILILEDILFKRL
jgi:hypothetical protein